jgi:hypothetical protein
MQGKCSKWKILPCFLLSLFLRNLYGNFLDGFWGVRWMAFELEFGFALVHVLANNFNLDTNLFISILKICVSRLFLPFKKVKT